MADMRRRSPEPRPGPPQIQLTPGLGEQTMRELAPLLAEEGIDVDNIDVPGLDTLQAALNRAVEPHNMARFTPVGPARDLAVTTLRLVIEALAGGDTTRAAAILISTAVLSILLIVVVYQATLEFIRVLPSWRKERRRFTSHMRAELIIALISAVILGILGFWAGFLVKK